MVSSFDFSSWEGAKLLIDLEVRKAQDPRLMRSMSFFFKQFDVIFAVAAIGTLNLRSHCFPLLEAIFVTGKPTRPIWFW